MKRIVNIDSKIQSLCAGDVELKESAKRVFLILPKKQIFKKT